MASTGSTCEDAEGQEQKPRRRPQPKPRPLFNQHSTTTKNTSAVHSGSTVGAINSTAMSTSAIYSVDEDMALFVRQNDGLAQFRRTQHTLSPLYSTTTSSANNTSSNNSTTTNMNRSASIENKKKKEEGEEEKKGKKRKSQRHSPCTTRAMNTMTSNTHTLHGMNRNEESVGQSMSTLAIVHPTTRNTQEEEDKEIQGKIKHHVAYVFSFPSCSFM